MSKANEVAAPVEPDLHSPTDLAFFGRPDVVLTPQRLTSAVRKRVPGQSWHGVIIVGCDGVQVEISFDHVPAWENCFEWLKQCILANQATTRITTNLATP
jgi:hypothetical protein